MFGLTEYAPSRRLLLVEAPVDCPAAKTVDWRSIWDRPNLAAEADATTKSKG
ncbi:MAG TPA: hypothetical protein VFE63_15695 [Roseiarcus sp.]|jgi:hypothetical protein|nr:hypothetical protein [Roseiarcus sp.]